MEKTQEYGSAYLYAEDLLKDGRYHTVQVTVEEVIPPNTIRAANKKLIDKWTLKFKDKGKALVLCKTNVALISYATGESVDKCVGKTLVLQPRFVEAFGDTVAAIRIIPPAGTRIRRGLKARMGTEALWGNQQPQEQGGDA